MHICTTCWLCLQDDPLRRAQEWLGGNSSILTNSGKFITSAQDKGNQIIEGLSALLSCYVSPIKQTCSKQGLQAGIAKVCRIQNEKIFCVQIYSNYVQASDRLCMWYSRSRTLTIIIDKR